MYFLENNLLIFLIYKVYDVLRQIMKLDSLLNACFKVGRPTVLKYGHSASQSLLGVFALSICIYFVALDTVTTGKFIQVCLSFCVLKIIQQISASSIENYKLWFVLLVEWLNPPKFILEFTSKANGIKYYMNNSTKIIK